MVITESFSTYFIGQGSFLKESSSYQFIEAISKLSWVTATFKSLNSGMYLITESLREIIPSSIKSNARQMVTILLIDQILIQESPSIFSLASKRWFFPKFS